MNTALIGYSGFVGGTLLRQTRFSHQYRSTDIGQIEGGHFDSVVCAGAPAQKWIANREPEEDLAKIEGLIAHLRHVTCERMVLISTVDVFQSAVAVDENTHVDEHLLNPYGRHRRLLERFVEDHFPSHLIVRLPGLVGPGLRKNVIYDYLHGNNVAAIDTRGIFQFYPMVNLWADIQIALDAKMRVVHLTAAPVSVADVFAQGFGRPLEQQQAGTPARYDMRTCHTGIFGGHGDYQYSVRETIQAVRAYVQSELVPDASKGVA